MKIESSNMGESNQPVESPVNNGEVLRKMFLPAISILIPFATVFGVFTLEPKWSLWLGIGAVILSILIFLPFFIRLKPDTVFTYGFINVVIFATPLLSFWFSTKVLSTAYAHHFWWFIIGAILFFWALWINSVKIFNVQSTIFWLKIMRIFNKNWTDTGRFSLSFSLIMWSVSIIGFFIFKYILDPFSETHRWFFLLIYLVYFSELLKMAVVSLVNLLFKTIKK